MYLEEADEVFDYWTLHPPTHQLVALIARMLGWEGPEKPEIDGDDLPDLQIELSPEMADAIGKAAGVPPPVIDLEAMRERNRNRAKEIALRQIARLNAE